MKHLAILTLFVASLTPMTGADATGTFSVAGLAFNAPEKWTSVQPASSMRKAQFTFEGKDGAAEIVFFHFGPGQGGGVQANINRWFGQFAEPKDQLNAKTEKKSVNGFEITYVSAEGTYLSGPPFGKKTPMENHALLGAIVKNDQGDIFVKMTGPKSTTAAAGDAFKEMVESAKH